MPHITVKLWPGKTEKQKKELADRIARETARCLDDELDWVTVAFEEIAEEDWPEVEKKEIEAHPERIFFPRGGKHAEIAGGGKDE